MVGLGFREVLEGELMSSKALEGDGVNIVLLYSAKYNKPRLQHVTIDIRSFNFIKSSMVLRISCSLGSGGPDDHLIEKFKYKD